MLIKATNRCGMGCSHCSEESTKAGAPMAWEVFLQTLDAVHRLEARVVAVGLPVSLLLSGGECTEHPEIARLIAEARTQRFHVVVITHGLWLNDPALRASLLRPEWPDVRFQVTNDPRFYPTAPPRVEDPRLTYVPAITHLIRLGRASRKRAFNPQGLEEKQAPGSFNFRSLVHGLRSIEEAVLHLRLRALAGKSGWCTPSIDEFGGVHAGESRLCARIGTVESTTAELTEAVLRMGACNTCGLEDRLGPAHRKAIGLPAEVA